MVTHVVVIYCHVINNSSDDCVSFPGQGGVTLLLKILEEGMDFHLTIGISDCGGGVILLFDFLEVIKSKLPRVSSGASEPERVGSLGMELLRPSSLMVLL